jgi:cyclic pyranopterin phosphate synthase
MIDRFGREIKYLRISVTDRCNLRCKYCMPACGVEKLAHNDILRTEEIWEIAEAAADIGINKIRITGGEPLVRRDIVNLCAGIAKINGIDELAITTNGILLGEYASELKSAGVSRVNISLDTLDPDKYRQITRIGELASVLAGIDAANKAGLTPIKLNAVLIKGFNDDEIEDFARLTLENPIDVRFIELMPIGEGAELWESAYMPGEEVLNRIPEIEPMRETGGVAKLYRLPGALGRIGIIASVSRQFCAECDKLRLTSIGNIKPCLHSSYEIPIRGLHGQCLIDALSSAVWAKPEWHMGLSAEHLSLAGCGMNSIGG